jgi:hypothetical protein
MCDALQIYDVHVWDIIHAIVIFLNQPYEMEIYGGFTTGNGHVKPTSIGRQWDITVTRYV